MTNIIEDRAKLDTVTQTLTVNQRRFLAARADTDTDVAACKEVGIAKQTITNWKRNSDFVTAYRLTLGLTIDPSKELAIPAKTRQELVVQQVDALTEVLPSVVREHIRLALYAEQEAVRLNAIKEVYNMVGFGVDRAMPVGKQSQVFIQMLSLMGPQVAAEAKRRGLPVSSELQDIINAQYRVIEQEEGESCTED